MSVSSEDRKRWFHNYVRQVKKSYKDLFGSSLEFPTFSTADSDIWETVMRSRAKCIHYGIGMDDNPDDCIILATCINAEELIERVNNLLHTKPKWTINSISNK